MNKSKTNSVSRSNQSIKKKRNLILDANAPKRPSGAYIIYATKGYKDFVSTHPEIKDKSKIMTAMAEHWKNMSDEEKKPYTDVAQANRNEYEKRLQEYKQTDVYRNFIEYLFCGLHRGGILNKVHVFDPNNPEHVEDVMEPFEDDGFVFMDVDEFFCDIEP